MQTTKVSVKVHIMNKEYLIQCGPDEKQRLIQAAGDIDNRMRQAKTGTISTEKAAVLTALNLANELQDVNQNNQILDNVSNSIINMNSRIDRVLEGKNSEKEEKELSDKPVIARL